MISFKKLQGILYKKQKKERHDVKTQDSFFVIHIIRKLAIYLIWLLMPLNITPSQITFLGMVVGLIAAGFFALGDYHFGIVAGFLVILWYVLDQVDGGIARLKKKCSIEGHNLDSLNAHLIELIISFGIVFGTFVKTKSLLLLGLGLIMVASFNSYSILVNLRYASYIFFKYHYKFKASEDNNFIKNQEQAYRDSFNPPGNLIKVIQKFSCFIFLFQLPTKVNLILLFSLLGRLEYFIYFYASVYPLFLIANIYNQYKKGLINFFKRTDIYLKSGDFVSFKDL